MTTPTVITLATYANGKIRRIHEGIDIVCQEYIDGVWVEFVRTNEMSNDYAYTETTGACIARAHQLRSQS
ncbi:hypothetical protein UFOVP669_31 [uncultured Caudovirales phage]|uniref:Uncharacterized protein n=1 Tax=uncultured Caudovirales phage TaxID=2100421 RepID=A0A6J5M4S5_9CAUD|nr:hypothetical protein UFOVP400_22 [uncultured Caudovirales phage]CAB4155868.1 hypothetical protein UFOVP669_31 [uncultured Caudovirales phage]CAB4213520.1 hypothetical protein UFOVP1449_40 [uncultured Caudovirales phage]